MLRKVFFFFLYYKICNILLATLSSDSSKVLLPLDQRKSNGLVSVRALLKCVCVFIYVYDSIRLKYFFNISDILANDKLNLLVFSPIDFKGLRMFDKKKKLR